MSEHSSAVDRRHFEYIAARTRAEDGFLLALKAAAREAGIPPIWIAPEQANFMQILLRAAGARRVLEVGTLAGYAAIQMARALPEDGRVVTLELDPARARFAQSWADRADSLVAGRVEVRTGDAGELLRSFEVDSFDAAFLDADKASYPRYLEAARRLVRPKGLILVDNAFAFGQLFEPAPTDREVPAVRAFNDAMARQLDLHAVIVPVGDGLWVACNERNGERGGAGR